MQPFLARVEIKLLGWMDSLWLFGNFVEIS